jgi:16S rRNA (guanine527-N7)-methyltransferase
LVSRAVSAIPDIAGWGRKLVMPGGRNSLSNGLLILKGGDLRIEMKGFENKAIVYDLEDYFEEDYFKTKN